MSLRRWSAGLVLALVLLVASGCAQTEEPVAEDESSTRRTLDPSFGIGGVTRLSMSVEAERILAVAPGSDGAWYGAGFLSTGGDHSMAVARFDENGDPDTSFGQNGFASVNVATGGKTAERASGIGVQSSGNVVLAGPVEHDPAAPGDQAGDTDIAAVRLTDGGAPDPTFGENGVARIDLGTGRLVEESFVGDTMFGVTVLEDDRILLVGAKLHDGPDETDRDFAVVRLTADGELDTTFGTEGVFVLDIENGNESPRQALELEDGSVVVAGYTRNGAGVVVPVLLKLDESGALVEDFDGDGIASDELLPSVGEAYAVDLHNGGYVITGYGRAAEGEKVDMVAARFTADGARDTEFGEDGLVRLDIAGEDDRGRDLVVLEDGSILIAGSAKPNATDINGMLVLLTPEGDLDTDFGRDGVYQVDLGGKSDSFFSVGLTEDGDSAVIGGWMGPDSAQGGNEEAVIARLAL